MRQLYTYYLGNADEAEALRQDGFVGELDGFLDGLVDRAVTEVDVRHIEFQICNRAVQ